MNSKLGFAPNQAMFCSEPSYVLPRTKLCFAPNQAMFCSEPSYVLPRTKLCFAPNQAMFCSKPSYVLLQTKLCFAPSQAMFCFKPNYVLLRAKSVCQVRGWLLSPIYSHPLTVQTKKAGTVADFIPMDACFFSLSKPL